MKIHLNPKMNSKIADIMRVSKQPAQMYGAALIDAYRASGLEPDEIPHWIDAEDETPDIGQTVLVYLPDKEEEKIRVGEYLGEGDYRIGRKVYRGYEIGAWMLLLQPPKEEK
ncbi:hypothetical protein [Caproiciproducens galactitolivorans]|uniref:DUF551 domain-containing protein n=1 Tax=Caproiciproducens galactitolivorans TaxID=642589 RepID=A0ABT4BWD4_9FIRM|nr:hypothetical protein [Caproiciproducens galactitolivorans]MCY1715206.1 hypothetical protein [Caproiciproducens galactitolivorans]